MGCASLTDVDLSEMHNVRAIDSFFLAGSRSLVTIDVTGLSQVTSVGGFFLCRCSALQRVVGLDSWVNVTDIGTAFLGECPAIASVDLSAIASSITRCGHGPLFLSTSLVAVQL